MTEQIEHELMAAFHERADRLEIQPPPPASAIRRARLQSSLAAAVVLALVGGVALVGERLTTAGGPSATLVSAADARDPMAALQRAITRTLAGRWRVTSTQYEVAGHAFGGVTEFDGARRVGIMRAHGQTRLIWVGDTMYVPVSDLHAQDRARLPRSAKWVAESAPEGAGAIAGVLLPAMFVLPAADQQRAGGVQITATHDGFRVVVPDGAGAAGEAVMTIVLRSGGALRSVRSEFPTAPAGSAPAVMEVDFAPLSGPLSVQAPDPATVVTGDFSGRSSDAQPVPSPSESCTRLSPSSVICWHGDPPPPDATPADGGTPAPSPSPTN